MRQKRSMTTGQHNHIETLWQEVGGNSQLFQKKFLDSGMLSQLFSSAVEEENREWREESNEIYFSVTSDGTTGEEWVTKLEAKTGKPVGHYAKSVLCSPDFKPTKGIIYNVVVVKGTAFTDGARTTTNIRHRAAIRKFATPHPEIACLIRMKFTDAQISETGLSWIITFHEPIKDSDGFLSVLGSSVGDYYCVYAYDDRAGNRWNRGGGFAFVVSQVGTQT